MDILTPANLLTIYFLGIIIGLFVPVAGALGEFVMSVLIRIVSWPFRHLKIKYKK